jgi:hypothetical protein
MKPAEIPTPLQRENHRWRRHLTKGHPVRKRIGLSVQEPMQQFDFFCRQGRREGGRNIALKVNDIRRSR